MGSTETWTTLLAIGVIALASGFVHSAIGFGFGIVALALVPLIMEVHQAHVVISLASIPMMMVAAWAYREGVDWRTLRVTVMGAVVFLPIGVLAFEYTPSELLVRGTGLAILIMACLSLRKPREHGQAITSTAECFFAGAASGFLAGAVSIAGPPVAAFALKQDWSQARFKAFVTQCLLVIAVGKGVLLVARDLVSSEAAYEALLAAPFAILGVQLGVLASRNIPAKQFKRIVAIVLILVALQMILRG